MSGEFPSSTVPPGGVSPGLHDPQRQRLRGVAPGGRSGKPGGTRLRPVLDGMGARPALRKTESFSRYAARSWRGVRLPTVFSAREGSPPERPRRKARGAQCAWMAAHESPRTTKLYDRTDDQITADEVEKIGI